MINDEDSELRLERTILVRKLIDIFWIPFLNSLPENFGVKFFEKSSRDGKAVKEMATTFKALEIMYDFDGRSHFKKQIKNPILRAVDGVFTFIWQHVHNVKAIRNRLKIVVRELFRAFKYFSEKGVQEISLVSIGAGSARAPYETIKLLAEKEVNVKVEIVLIDKDQEALNYSEYLSGKYSLPSNISFHRICCKISDLPMAYDKKIDIVEAAGLFDYFNDEKAVEKFKLIYERLKDKGYFVVSNIMPNKERPFVEKIIRWRGMYYRREDEFIKILMEAGFKEENIKIFIEPQGIHMIAVAKKS